MVNFEAHSWDPEEANFYWSIAPVTVDSLSNITAFHPANAWGWSHPNAAIPVVNEMPDWLNVPAGGSPLAGRGDRPMPRPKG